MSGFLFNATKRKIRGRGTPPDSFLSELLDWGRCAPDEIFAVNAEPGDVMTKLRVLLGPWEGEPGTPARLLHRKAAMLELFRCLGGFESSWKWTEGVDRTNRTSMANIAGQETGVFQVSYDSLELEKRGTALRDCIARHCATVNVHVFLQQMKLNHVFAFEYCARLLRISYLWNGPIKRDEINSSLSREAVAEFQRLLAA